MALPSQIESAARAGRKKEPVGTSLLNDKFVDTIPDASEEKWRKFGIRVCAHSIEHDWSRDDLVEMLTALGVKEDPNAPEVEEAPEVPVLKVESERARRTRLLGEQTRNSLDDSWTDRAECRFEDPELFFPLSYTDGCAEQISKARSVCARCPVTQQCLEYSLLRPERDGIWSATLPEQRESMRRSARRSVKADVMALPARRVAYEEHLAEEGVA